LPSKTLNFKTPHRVFFDEPLQKDYLLLSGPRPLLLSCSIFPIPVSYAGIAGQRRLCQLTGFSNVTCLDGYSLQESILFTRIIPDNVIAKPFDRIARAGRTGAVYFGSPA